MSDKPEKTWWDREAEYFEELTKGQRSSELAAPAGSTLTNDLARNAWLILNHDNDMADTSDPCHKANWEKLVKSTRAILRAHKIKA